MFEINTLENEITSFVDFKKADSLKFDCDLSRHFDMTELHLGLERGEPELYYKLVDDLMIIDGSADVSALEKYYKSQSTL